MKAYAKELKNKRILVVGIGRSGKAAVDVLTEIGAEVEVHDARSADKIDDKLIANLDNAGIKRYLGRLPEDISGFDMFVLSPGVPTDQAFIEEAKAHGTEVIGELELAYRFAEGRFVAITGTNGKTTTTALVGEIFKAAGRKSSVVGNIGVAAITSAASSESDEWLVTECSSFQLETVSEFKPLVSALLNITPDHIDRHKSMENYAKAKAAIFARQTEDDYLVINMDDEVSFALAKNCRAKIIPFSRKKVPESGAFIRDGKIMLKIDEKDEIEICAANELKIIGNHNIENALAASAIAYCAGVDAETIGAAIRAFPGVEHRIEYCGSVDGVSFYNDSKGTNVDAAIIAVKALENDIILIAGGDGKGQSFDALAEMLEGRVKALVLLGRDADKIDEAARAAGFTEIYREKDMNACVKRAVELASEGDKVLLSPACASWDMYDNFEQRGRHFKTCVADLLR